MNEFKKEELELIAECVEFDFYHANWSKNMYEPLINKIQSMINNYPDSTETEIFSCHTALAVSDEYFCKQQHMTKDDLLPAIHQLAAQCEGMIKQAGIYKLEFKVIKIK